MKQEGESWCGVVSHKSRFLKVDSFTSLPLFICLKTHSVFAAEGLFQDTILAPQNHLYHIFYVFLRLLSHHHDQSFPKNPIACNSVHFFCPAVRHLSTRGSRSSIQNGCLHRDQKSLLVRKGFAKCFNFMVKIAHLLLFILLNNHLLYWNSAKIDN